MTDSRATLQLVASGFVMTLAVVVVAAPLTGAPPAGYYAAADGAEDDDRGARLHAAIAKGQERLSGFANTSR